MDPTQTGCIVLARGPDSPPTITQWMRSRSRLSSGPISGSHDRNRTCAGTAAKSAIRPFTRAFSILTPIQIFGDHGKDTPSFREGIDIPSAEIPGLLIAREDGPIRAEIVAQAIKLTLVPWPPE